MPEPAFVDLRRRLLVGGVAPRRVRRLLQELRDHHEELVLEQQRRGSPRPAEAAMMLLGDEESLARQLLARPELLSWSRRWPWAVYTLGPLLVFPVAFIATICVMVALAHVLNGMRQAAPAPFLRIMDTIRFFGLYLVPVIAAFGLALVATRRGVSTAWVWLSMAVVAVLGSLTNVQVSIHQIGAGVGVTSRPTVLVGLFIHRWLPTAAAAAALYAVARYWDLRRERAAPG